MSQLLPRLRTNLDFMPSPVPDRPGLLLRDSYQYSGATLIIPPVLAECLTCFDGEHTESDLREILYRVTGDLNVGGILKHLLDTLSEAGFLENEVYAGLKEEAHRRFAEARVREASHAGSAYPETPDELQSTLARYMGTAAQAASFDHLVGIAAPHVSPEGGWECYRDAYRALTPEHKGRTFAILGTSHYGEPERFGLTRKPFCSPIGETETDVGMVDRLAAGAPDAVKMEDYCHSVEHSIEFQVVFLQHLFGPDIRILPILCGPYAKSIYEGGKPEDDEKVRRFLGALGELAAKEGDRLVWVLGIDMAHMGRRYGDPFPALADREEMVEVAERDRTRIESVNRGDAEGFWEQVQENHDDLKWCGASPLYTFLKAAPGSRGTLLNYQHWNIDEKSVVSFAALSFRS